MSESKKNPDNANKPHDDILRPKKFNSVIDKIRLAKSTAPVAATYTTRFAAKLSAFRATWTCKYQISNQYY